MIFGILWHKIHPYKIRFLLKTDNSYLYTHTVCSFCIQHNTHTDEHNSVICVGQIEVFWDISAKDTIDIKTEHYLNF